MNAAESEILPPGEPKLNTPSLEQLQRQVQSLHSLLVGALMALLLLSVAVTVFVVRQENIVRKDLANVRAATRGLIADYETHKQPLIQTFISKLQEYARTHPDFNPILQKYNIPPHGAPAQSGQPPASASAPTAPPSKSP